MRKMGGREKKEQNRKREGSGLRGKEKCGY